jgi:NAD(P)-dependent dehydrogenase (short-subunit alcohol dehydrogenase family)
LSGPAAAPARLSGRAAFVTGASRGIGEAIARRFAAEGAAVALAARSRDDCERIAAELRASGADAVALTCDVTDRASSAGAIDSAAGRWGRLDVLVNNAGLSGPTPLADPDDSRWDEIVAANLTAVFRVTREAAPKLSDGGRVINMSSVLGRFGVAGYAAYCATKHGVIGLTRALALETATKGITVNAVCPSYTDTDMSRAAVANIVAKTGRSAVDAEMELVRKNPQGRLIRPEEVAATVLWLCAPGSEAITGQAIAIAGGEVM